MDLGLTQEQALRLKCLEMVDREAMDRAGEADKLVGYITGETECSARLQILRNLLLRFNALLDQTASYDRALAIFSIESGMNEAFAEAGLRAEDFNYRQPAFLAHKAAAAK